MWRDSIVEKIRRNRQVYAAKFHHDVKEQCLSTWYIYTYRFGDMRRVAGMLARNLLCGRKCVSITISDHIRSTFCRCQDRAAVAAL